MKDVLENDRNFNDLAKRFLALAFLPAHMIEPQYQEEKDRMTEYIDSIKEGVKTDISRKIKAFFNYYERYWLGIVTPEGFSVYRLSRRTNNCSESFNSILGTYLAENGQRPVPSFFCRK